MNAHFSPLIRQISDPGTKQLIAARILGLLPEWFGLPDSTAIYISESCNMPFWAAFSQEDPIGFIALKETSPFTAEIFVMGVHPDYHRHGVGKALFSAFLAYARQHGYEYLQVKTVAEGHYPEYDRTRFFYESLGFRKLEVFPTLWDEWNPCLILIRSV
ncbi:MAG: GNAT family N-acetyltransferase [Candidatus Merdivicinus sp.]|jgi:GNAT superfamily N-acetyltransferase